MHLDDITRGTINSLADLMDLEETLTAISGEQTLPTRWGFRGQSRLYGALSPSFQRMFGDKRPISAAQIIEKDLINSFRTHYAKLPHRTPDMPVPEVIAQGFDLRCLSAMQHYGVPTRLLDWTSGIWTAMYFACAGDPSADAELWMYDRQMFRQQAFTNPLQKSLVRIVSSREGGSLSELPLLKMQGRNLILELHAQLTPRMREQNGHHTVASDLFVDHAKILFELYRETITSAASTVARDGFRRYVISRNCKEKTLRFLADHKQITAATIFPDVEGLGRFLRWHLDSLLTTLM